MKYSTSLLLALLVFLFSCKDETEKQINSKSYPNADAVYVKMVKEFVLNDDGSIEYNYSHKLKLLTHFAFNRKYGETFIEYNPEYQQVEVTKSYTVMADGKKVKTPKSAFNEVLPRNAAHSPYYNNLREMVITHTALEVNSNIVLNYSVNSNADFFPYLIGNELLAANSPIKELKVIIRIPEDKDLNYKLLNDTATANLISKRGEKIFTWTFKDIAAISPEAFQPNKNTLYPNLIFSSADNYNEIHDYILNQMAFSYSIDKETSKEISSMINVWHPKSKHLYDMHNFVLDNFNYCPVNEKHKAYKIRTVQEIWNANGGSKLEKTLLLSAILNEAGILAQPVAVASSELFDDSCGNPLLFEDYLVKTGFETVDDIYVSAIHSSKQSEIYNLVGKVIIPIDINDKTRYVVDLPNHYQRCDFIGKGKINNDISFDIDIFARMQGGLNPYLTLLKDPNKSMNLFNDIQWFKADKIAMNESVLNLKISTDNNDKQSGYVFVKIPEYKYGFSKWHIPNLPEQRNTPFQLPSKIEENYSYSIELPKNATVISSGFSADVSNNVGRVKITITQTDNMLLFERSLKLLKEQISVEEYPAFVELIKLWNNKKYKEIVIKK